MLCRGDLESFFQTKGSVKRNKIVYISIMLNSEKITAVFLLYNASKTVPALVKAVYSQYYKGINNQSDWLDVIFIDDCSRDNTLSVLDQSLDQINNPSHYQIIKNEKNLGLAATINKALESVKTPFVLTCHCDCFFGSEDYIAEMHRLLSENPQIGALAGQSYIPEGIEISFAEKVNVITNLMDIFPADRDHELCPVGFAEGRCDGFNMEALRKVAFYDTSLRTAGEDQVLAAKLRKNGYKVLQAVKLKYHLSVSDEQDSIRKLMRHQALFGRAHPFILLKNEGTHDGVSGEGAGTNRQLRMLLRVSQIFGVIAYLWVLLGLFWGISLSASMLLIGIVFFFKIMIFMKHLKVMKLSMQEYYLFFSIQPLLDFSYVIGLIQGVYLLKNRTENKPIA